MATKQKRPSFMSPKGTFIYPALVKPDYGTQEYPKPDGEYKTAISMPLEDAQPLIDKLMPLWQEAIAEGQIAFDKMEIKSRKKFGELTENMFYEEEYDKETEEPTGNVIFKVKTKYMFRKKDKVSGEETITYNKIGLFDAKGKPLGKNVDIYGGTVGRVSFQVQPYWIAGQGMAGLTLRLGGAQVIELVGPGARSAASFGFDEVEGGYEAGEDEGGPEDRDEDPGSDDTDAGPVGAQDF